MAVRCCTNSTTFGNFAISRTNLRPAGASILEITLKYYYQLFNSHKNKHKAVQI
jgi:hypothetical protein